MTLQSATGVPRLGPFGPALHVPSTAQLEALGSSTVQAEDRGVCLGNLSRVAARLHIRAPPFCMYQQETRFWKTSDLRRDERLKGVNYSSGYTFQVGSKWSSPYQPGLARQSQPCCGPGPIRIAVP